MNNSKVGYSFFTLFAQPMVSSMKYLSKHVSSFLSETHIPRRESTNLSTLPIYKLLNIFCAIDL